jgi:CPA2 family monovalent cation:H+ antiporter-2
LALVLALVVIGKTTIIYFILRVLKHRPVQALATGLTLAQVGEFSFVLASAAREGSLIDANQFALVVSVTILSMFMAPYLVTNAESWATWLLKKTFRGRPATVDPASPPDTADSGHILIIGFGPAGQQVAQTLIDREVRPHIIELNPQGAHRAEALQLPVYIGDATSTEFLEHAGIDSLCAAVVTIPDPATSLNVIANLRSLVPDVPIIVRARYHRHTADLKKAGATMVIDEETKVGEAIDLELQNLLLHHQQAAMACALAGQKPVPFEK